MMRINCSESTRPVIHWTSLSPSWWNLNALKQQHYQQVFRSGLCPFYLWPLSQILQALNRDQSGPIRQETSLEKRILGFISLSWVRVEQPSTNLYIKVVHRIKKLIRVPESLKPFFIIPQGLIIKTDTVNKGKPIFQKIMTFFVAQGKLRKMNYSLN